MDICSAWQGDTYRVAVQDCHPTITAWTISSVSNSAQQCSGNKSMHMPCRTLTGLFNSTDPNNVCPVDSLAYTAQEPSLCTAVIVSIAVVGIHNCRAGLPCEDHSLCNGRNKLCIARGPAWPDNFRSNEIIAQRQADKAKELLMSATEDVSGETLEPSKDQ